MRSVLTKPTRHHISFVPLSLRFHIYAAGAVFSRPTNLTPPPAAVGRRPSAVAGRQTLRARAALARTCATSFEKKPRKLTYVPDRALGAGTGPG